jgi:SAM-dependent methyltransferase
MQMARLALLSPTNGDGAYPGCARQAQGGWRPVAACDYLSFMLRGAAVEEVGFLNPAFTYCWGAIHEYAYKLYSAGWVVGYSDDVTYEHLGGTTYGAPGTNTIGRDEYQERAAAFAAQHMRREYGDKWDELFWQAAAGHGIETNVYASVRRYWEEVAPEAEPVQVQLGSGNDYREGWINVDTDPACGPDIVGRAEDLPMLDDASVDLIEGCHLFEHLTFSEARAALREWHRVLRPGGELFLELPNLAASIAILGQHFDENGHDLGMVGIYGWPPDIDQHGVPMMHKWGWTPETIAVQLRAAGFGVVEQVQTTQRWRPADKLGRNMRIRAVKAQVAALAA